MGLTPAASTKLRNSNIQGSPENPINSGFFVPDFSARSEPVSWNLGAQPMKRQNAPKWRYRTLKSEGPGHSYRGSRELSPKLIADLLIVIIRFFFTGKPVRTLG